MRPHRRRVPGFLPALAVAALVSLAYLGCRGEPPPGDPSLRLELAISPTPPAVGPARLILTLSDTAGAPVPGASIRVEGNMSHAGMVPVVDTAEAVSPGRYVIPAFTFSMAGDWVLTARAVLPDGRWTEARVPTGVFSVPPAIREEGAPGTQTGATG
jgi:hypothetical protein